MPPSPSFSSSWTQFRPPKPTFTEKDLPDLRGKTYIVTGANSGLGKEVARVLYSKNAKVYAAARSREKADAAIEEIKKAAPDSAGELIFLHLDLADLNQVKTATQEFLSREDRLHVLFNNAGVMGSDVKSPVRTAHGHEITLGINCVGTLLFTQLLTPTLAVTAASSPPASVRVVWLASFGVELYGEKDVGLPTDNLDYHRPVPGMDRYGLSKVGVWALGVEYARRHRADGIVSVPINPGNLRTELAREKTALFRFLVTPICYPPPMGAATELFAALSPDVTMEKSGSWVIPFGRFGNLRPDLLNATKLEDEGGTGGTAKFWEWTEEQIKEYL
ncbi:putative estradiol 17 beta-dehydrogenase [Lasiosphaeria ovina]|uniref:Estradiol 17 beta-dehydrogenase n=1 Tax=Lasiosphaeria ovina TaxID=92902 RepID=A0AAE0MY11_9PEZI|nr:putative estradiol 17 beta-dehydrogenase [Lasiosphaeria ovina]